MARFVAVAALLLAACGVSDDRFVSDLAEGDCAYALQCFDDPVLNQYGWTDQETCVAERGSRIAGVQESCLEYDKKKARECIKALDGRSCAEREGPDDFGRPAICDEVFTSCEEGDTDGGSDVDTDDPADDTDG